MTSGKMGIVVAVKLSLDGMGVCNFVNNTCMVGAGWRFMRDWLAG